VRWRALGPVALGLLLAGRTLAADGLEPAIGLSIALVLVTIGIAAGRGNRWAGGLALIGPVALLTTPAVSELAFSLVRPGDRAWFAFAVATAAAAGASIATATSALVAHPATHRGAPVVTLVGAALFAVALGVIDPQPDTGRGLDATRASALPTVDMVNYAYAGELGRVIVDVDGQRRLQMRLTNPSDLPHTFTVDELGLEVYVPAGRETVVDVAVPARRGTFTVHCAIGDHLAQGMVTSLVVD
jgi:hypothetical protein